MELNQLIRLRNQLSHSLRTDVLREQIDENCQRLSNLIADIDQDLILSIDELIKNHHSIKEQYQRDFDQLQTVIAEVQNKIDQASAQFFTTDYQNELNYRTADSIRQVRIINYDEEFVTALTQRINLYSNYVYPALEIGCRDGEWTKKLVASDPLYIADVFEDFLTSAVRQFPSLYQGRVRKYLITNFYQIDNLPKNQFGLIFSYNFFNYLSIDSITQLLKQIFDWLRPGGVVVFTYNNADFPMAASYAEQRFMSYVPASILIPIIQQIGFEVEFRYDCDPAFSFIELKKPGQLKSIKVGQTMGEIKYIIN